MQPNFLVIGAAKCGTTTLCDLLAAHPEVFVTDPKEPHYFSRITTFDRKRAWYRTLFEGSEEHRARGEGSTSYSHPHRIEFVAPRLAEAVPDARLIYMVRHPIRRLESDWRMRRLEGRAEASIGKAVDRQASLLTLGQYWKNLQVYREHFPDEQILVVFLEDLATQPEEELERVYGHVGVDPSFRPVSPGRKRNTAAERRRAEVARDIKSLVPGARRLKAVLPEWLVDSSLRLLANRKDDDDEPLEWDRQSLDSVLTFYRSDASRLLEHCGKPRDFWDLS